MPRHQLTPEERRRGGKAAYAKLQASGKSHRFTLEDCQKGAQFLAWLIQIDEVPNNRHLFTPEERRRGGLARQAQRRAKQRLGTLYDEVFPAAPFIRTNPIDAALARVGERLGIEEEVQAVLEGPPEGPLTPDQAVSPPPDPFTLSALKRFRLGPLSPLQLTRGQRAHIPILHTGGWIEQTSGSMLRLTEKGQKAIEGVP